MKKNVMTVMNSIESEIAELYSLYREECEDIALGCEEEGYPAYGSNYNLRCEYTWDSYYRPEIEALEEELEEEKREHLFVSFFDALPGMSQNTFNMYRNGLQPNPVLTGYDRDGFPVWSN